jgi:hypothetical protein
MTAWLVEEYSCRDCDRKVFATQAVNPRQWEFMRASRRCEVCRLAARRVMWSSHVKDVTHAGTVR